MKKQLTLFFFHLFIGICTLSAQHISQEQSLDCAGASIICNIDELDGYVLQMSNSQLPGNGPNPLCAGQGGVPNNPSWIAFKAWCTDLTLICSVSNCTGQGGSNGIQTAIYSSCNPYTPVACNVSPANCNLNDKTITMTGLVIGATYYFLVDGCAGSYCTVTIDVVGTCGNPVIQDWKGPIVGPKETCSKTTNTYSIEKVTGAINYIWYLNGVAIKNSAENDVSLGWTKSGVYTLCVDAYNNPCILESDSPSPTCIDITVNDNSNITNIPAKNICSKDSITYNGVSYGVGNHKVKLSNAAGCDSLVTFELVAKPDSILPMESILLCLGDTVNINGVPYTKPAQFEVITEDTNFCTVSAYDIFFKNLSSEILNACQGDTLNFENMIATTNGIYYVKSNDQEPCDSIKKIEAIFHPNFTSLIKMDIEKGIVFKGIEINADTVLIFNYETIAHGCDSIITYDLNTFTITNTNEANKNLLKLFPNPGTSTITISTAYSAELVEYHIYNQLGQMVISVTNSITFPITVNIEKLSPGIYYWRGKLGSNWVTMQFTKQNN